MHRPRGAGAGADRGGHGPRQRGPDVARLAGQAGRRGQVEGEPHRGAEDAHLVGGLVGTGAAQLVRPVGGQDEKRQPGVVRLEDGGVQVRHGGAGRGDHGHGEPRRFGGGGRAGEAEREEGGGALVDPHVQPQRRGADGSLVGVRRVRERESERRAATAGGEDDVAHTERGQRLDEHAGGVGRGGRHAAHHAARARRSPIPPEL